MASLQSLPLLPHVLLPHASVPDGDTAGQDALNTTVVEAAEDLRQHAKLPQPPQDIQPLLGLFTSCVVLSDRVRSSLMWTPRYLKLLTLST